MRFLKDLPDRPERNRPQGNPSEFEDGCGCLFLACFITVALMVFGLAYFAAVNWK